MLKNWSLNFNWAFKWILLLNYTLMLVFYYFSRGAGLNYFSGFSYSVISWSCNFNTWTMPVHAGSILASVAFSSIAAVVFALHGRFSVEEIKLERRGGSVPVACMLTLVMMVFFCIFFLPCGGMPEESIQLSNVRFGVVLIDYIRENYFLFSLVLSVLSAGIFYALALAIKLFTLRK